MNIDNVAERLGGICPAGMDEFNPMSDTEIESVEAEITASLPIAYRSILARYGAFTFQGRSEDDPFIYFSSKETLPDYLSNDGLSIIRSFYGRTLNRGPSGLLQQIRFFQDRIPETMIPIAGDGGAGQVCLGIKGDDCGKVFYWDMANEPLDEETYFVDYGEPMPGEAKRQNIYLIANSYEEFLDQLMLRPAGGTC